MEPTIDTQGHAKKRRTPCQEFFDFELTDDELIDRSRKMAQIRADLRVAEYEFDHLKKERKSQITILAEKVDSLIAIIHAGKEERRVECIVEDDFEKGMRSWIFNSKVLKTRPLQDHERQMNMET